MISRASLLFACAGVIMLSALKTARLSALRALLLELRDDLLRELVHVHLLQRLEGPRHVLHARHSGQDQQCLQRMTKVSRKRRQQSGDEIGCREAGMSRLRVRCVQDAAQAHQKLHKLLA